MDLSVLIAARNEMFLRRTIEDVLSHARGETEIIVVLDGTWADPPIEDHPRVTLIHKSVPIGQRAAVNLAAKLSTARYLMKLDAHCAVDEGFDVKLIVAGDELGPDVTQIPAMYNLHAFNWRCQGCGTETYQGPTPTACATCAEKGTPGGPFTRVIYWDRKAGGVPGRELRTEHWRFDHDLHFQYWHEARKRPEVQGEIADVMSSVGACFFMARSRFEQIGGLDESHGSWGQFGTEIACKSWLSGGRHVINKGTWFAHLFRTQGGDFGFPYPNPGSQVDQARKQSRRLWLENTWQGQTRPLSWLLERFAPIPGWHEPAGKDESRETRALREQRLGEVQRRGLRAPAVHPARTKGLVYYTDNRLEDAIAVPVQERLAAMGLPIVSASLEPLAFGRNVVLPLARGVLTMFRQILAGLEALDTDIAFLVEHDVLYHPSHFTFTPPRDDVFYFNQHRWQVRASDGHAVHYRASQTSGCCAFRQLLIDHYRQRIAHVEAHGWDRNLGYEPGTNARIRAIDPHGSATWFAPAPNIDIRHGGNLSKSKWSLADFRNPANAIDWTEADAVPGWGVTRGRFAAFLAEVARREVAA